MHDIRRDFFWWMNVQRRNDKNYQFGFKTCILINFVKLRFLVEVCGVIGTCENIRHSGSRGLLLGVSKISLGPQFFHVSQRLALGWWHCSYSIFPTWVCGGMNLMTTGHMQLFTRILRSFVFFSTLKTPTQSINK